MTIKTIGSGRAINLSLLDFTEVTVNGQDAIAGLTMASQRWTLKVDDVGVVFPVTAVLKAVKNDETYEVEFKVTNKDDVVLPPVVDPPVTPDRPTITSPVSGAQIIANRVTFEFDWDRKIDIQIHSTNPGAIPGPGDIDDSKGLLATNINWTTKEIPDGDYFVRIVWPPENNVWPNPGPPVYGVDSHFVFPITVNAAAAAKPVFSAPLSGAVIDAERVTFEFDWDRKLSIQIHSTNPGAVVGSGDVANSSGLGADSTSWTSQVVPNGEYFVRVAWPPEDDVWPSPAPSLYDADKYLIFPITVDAIPVAKPVFTSPSYGEVLDTSQVTFDFDWDRKISIQIHSTNPGSVVGPGDVDQSAGLVASDTSWTSDAIPNGDYFVRVGWPPESDVWPTGQTNYDADKYLIFPIKVDAEVVVPPTGNSMTFAQIRTASRAEAAAQGRARTGFPTGTDYVDSHLGEFLRFNPDCSNWSINGTTITALAPREPTGSIVTPNNPSGGNDHSYIASLLSSNSGKDIVFDPTKTYLLGSTVTINSAVRVWNLNTKYTGSISTGYQVNAANVEFHNSPINANNRPNAITGWRASKAAHNFKVIKSGFKNVRKTGGGVGAAVRIHGGRDFLIACNVFKDLSVSGNPNGGDSAWIMRGVWSNELGGETTASPPGYIVNNVAENFTVLKNNDGTTDPEFFGMQGYAGSAGRVKILANRCLQAGKRMVKFQSGDGFVASNTYEWTDKNSPLVGSRIQLNMVDIQVASNDVTAINNRFKTGPASKYGAIFSSSANVSGHTQTNIHFDYNDIEITDDPVNTSSATGMLFRDTTAPSGSNNKKLVNCSIKGNLIRGSGGLGYVIDLNWGYPNNGSGLGLVMSGNEVKSSVRITGSVFRNSSASLPS